MKKKSQQIEKQEKTKKEERKETLTHPHTREASKKDKIGKDERL